MTTPPAELSRLRWQRRRGMRELDQLLSRYLDDRYSLASGEEKGAFERLLALSDPELVAYLLKKERPQDAGIATVIDRILGDDPA